MTYPKEVLDALARDHDIHFKGQHRMTKDTRLAYGATCTWFGPIQEVGESKEYELPVCPYCKGVLFELATEQEWWDGIDKFEREQPYPGYRAIWEWQQTQKRCFPTLNALTGAYAKAMDI